MRLLLYGKRIHNFLETIYDPGYLGEYKPKYNIWPVRLAILIYLFFYFHWLNNLPFSDPVFKLEVVYGLYILLMYLISRGNLSVETQLVKLVFDLLFVSIFEYISVLHNGSHSGLYVLFIIPVIYCSYWFRWYVTIVYVNIAGTIYLLINYNLLDMGIRFGSGREIFRILGPVIVLFYLVAGAGYYYKRKIQRSRAEEKKYTFTQNLLESSFDAIMAADEDGRITSMNESACKLLGYTSGEIIGKKVADFYAKGEAKKVMKALRESKDGSIVDFKTIVVTRAGEKKTILLSAAFLCDTKIVKEKLADGRRFPTLGYFKDIRAEVAIDEIARSITSSTNESELLKKLVEKVAMLFKAEACSLFAYNENTSDLRVVTSFGMPRELKLAEWYVRYSENEGLVGECFRTKISVNVSDINVDNKKPESHGIKWGYAENFSRNSRYGDFKHFLGTPLQFHGEVYGVICLLNKYSSEIKLDPLGFTDEDLKILQKISTQVSILVEKVRDKDRFEKILKVGEKLNEMQNAPLEKILEKVAKDVVSAMHFKACYLRLIESGDVLAIKAQAGLKGKYIGKSEYNLYTGDKSITGRVVKSGGYVKIGNLALEPGFKFQKIAQEEHLESMLSMPLKYRGRAIGVINCFTGKNHDFTEQEIQILKTFAAYATTAIQNKKRVDEFRALNEISGELVKPIKLEELLSLVLEKAKSLSGADRVCIKIYDESDGTIKTSYSVNCPWHDRQPGAVSSVWDQYGNNESLEVYRSGKSKIVPNYKNIKKFTENLPNYDLIASIQSCVMVPVTIEAKVYGVIHLESELPHFFTEDDLPLLEAFSSQVAIALKNAKFVDKLQRVTETFPRISELSLDIGMVLENIVNVAAEVLESDVLVLFEYDQKNKKMESPPIVSGNLFYPEILSMPLGQSDAPYYFVNREKEYGYYYFANNSLKDEVMNQTTQPREGIPARFLEREKIKSSASILLKVGQETVGVMFVNYRDKHTFNEDERRIILNFASYIAIAMQNVRHFKEKESLVALDSVQKLAAAIAHKMKNDIGAIRLNTDRLFKRIKPSSSGHEILVDIDRVLGKTVADIEALLRASRLHEQDIQVLDFLKYLRKLESEEIAPDLKAKGIELKIEISGNIPKLRFDPLQLKMVFSNLVHNSISAMPNGGKVFLSVLRESRDVIIYWWDTGPGVAVEYASKIFEPYWSTKGKGSGFGVGLFLSKRVIEEHGGTMTLDIENKIGAKFVIKLPVKESIHDRGRN